MAALVPALASAEPSPSGTPGVVPAEREVPEVARGLLVRTSQDSDAVVRRMVALAADGAVDVLLPQAGSGGLDVVDFAEPVDLDTAFAIAEEVAARPDVEVAVPNRRIRAAATSPNRPNDPLFGRQLQLWDAAAKKAGGYSTKAPAAWGATKGAGSVVAVLDTGVVLNHPDLVKQLVPGYDMIGPDQDENGASLPVGDPFRFYTSNDGDGRDADPSDPGDWVPAGDTYCYGERLPEQQDSSWHGTHVAGIVAAQQWNGTGMSGVAPLAKVQPVRVLGRCGGWDSDLLDGITWASGGTVPGVPANPTPADVINLSLGGYLGGANAQYVPLYCDVYGTAMGQALQRGAVTVVAAGNELGNANLAVPAACPNAISVGATARSGLAAFYTNKGSSVDLSAYGGDDVVEGRSVLSSINGGTRGPTSSQTYAEYMGTSMAAPAVAGAAALVMSLGVPPNRVETVLERSVQAFPPVSTKNRVTLSDGTKNITVDLNCSTRACGKGALDLTRLPFTTSMHVASKSLRYGTATTVTGRVMLDGRAVQGPVEVRRGSTVIGRGTTGADGSVKMTVKGTSWVGGANAIRVVYAGRWSSATQTVNVAKLTSSIHQDVPTSVSKSANATVAVTVKVAGVTHPTGQLRIYDGARLIASSSLTSTSGGKKRVQLPKLAAGTHRIKTVYWGNATIAGATSPVRTVTSR